MAYQQLAVFSNVTAFRQLLEVGKDSLTPGQLEAVSHYFLLLAEKESAAERQAGLELPALASSGLSPGQQRKKIQALLPYIELNQFLAEVRKVEEDAAAQRRALEIPASLHGLPHISSAGSDSILEASSSSDFLAIGDEGISAIAAPTHASQTRSGSAGGGDGAASSSANNTVAVAAPVESPRVITEIETAFEKFRAMLEGDAVNIHEAMALATHIVAHREAPAAATRALHADAIGAVVVVVAQEGAGLQAHAVIDEAAIADARTAARAWCQCPKQLKLAGMVLVAFIYGFNYALVAGYEAYVVTEDIGFSVFCALASFCANFAQIFATQEKMIGDIKSNFNVLRQGVNSRVIFPLNHVLSLVLFPLLILAVALAAAVPVGSSIINAFKYLEDKGLDLGSASQGLPVASASLMYIMRTALVVRGVFNMPGSMYNKAKLFCYSGRRGDIATISAAALGFAAALLIGIFYSHGQIKTTTDFLGELWPTKFSEDLIGKQVAYAIALFGFFGSSFLNINYVGNGTQAFLNLIFSMQGATKLVSFLFLLWSIPTLFPGVAFVTGGLGTKIMGGIATWMSNYASYLDLVVIGRSLKYSVQRDALHEQVNLLTGLSRLLKIATEEGECHLRSAEASNSRNLRQLVDSYKKDQVSLDAMVGLLNVLIRTMDQKDALNVYMQGAREKVQRGLRACLNTPESARVAYDRVVSCFSGGYQRVGENRLVANNAPAGIEEAIGAQGLPSYLGGAEVMVRRRTEPSTSALSRSFNVSLLHLPPRRSAPSSGLSSSASSQTRRAASMAHSFRSPLVGEEELLRPLIPRANNA